jgi:hypothetical protein
MNLERVGHFLVRKNGETKRLFCRAPRRENLEILIMVAKRYGLTVQVLSAQSPVVAAKDRIEVEIKPSGRRTPPWDEFWFAYKEAKRNR